MKARSVFASVVAVAATLLISAPRLASIALEDLQRIDERGAAELAAHHYEAALAIFRDGFEQAKKSNAPFFIAVFSAEIGNALYSLERDDEAAAPLNDALRIFRSLHDSLREAYVLTVLASIDNDLGRLEESLEKFRKAQKIYHELKSPLEVEGVSGAGAALSSLGRYSEAMQMLDQALAMDRVIGDAQPEAYDLTEIAFVEMALGQYDAALRDLENARRAYRALHNPYGEATTVQGIGNVYFAMGRNADAYAQYQEALEAGERLHRLRGQAGVLSNMSVIVGDEGDPKTALILEQKAYAIQKQLKDAFGQAATLVNIGITQEKLGQIEPALESERQALAISQGIHDLEGEASAYSNIGSTLAIAGRFKESIEPLAKSVAINRTTGEAQSWIAQGWLAYAQGKLGQNQGAFANFDAAIKAIESVRGSISQVGNRTSFVQGKLYVFNKYIEFLLELDRRYPGKDYDRKALEIFERKQGRAFLEQIGQSGATRFSGVPNDVLQRENDLEQDMKETQAQMVKARSSATPDPAHITELEDRLRSTEAAQHALLAQIKSTYPEYYALKYPRPAGIDAVQHALRPGEVILVYDVTGSGTNLWLVGPEATFSVFPLGASLGSVASRVSDFREGPNQVLAAIENKQDVAAIARATLNDFAQTSYQLYQWLVPEKARELLARAELIYIVPTGPLYELPFEALVTLPPSLGQRPHYFIEDHALAYLSSASLLTLLRQAQQQRKASQPHPLLAFADPVFDSSNTNETTITMGKLRKQAYGQLLGGEFARLPETRQLATTISQILKSPADSKPLWLGEQASRDNVLTLNDTHKLADYRYVIFATHAVLPNEVDRLAQPALVLAHPEKNGFLTMGDVFSLKLNADFVVLSACNTGRGTHVTGEGVVGLTRAFMYAGTPSVSVTLWSVEVGSTSELDISLFRHLQNGDKLAQALRNAKLDILNGSDLTAQHPYFWAPLVLFGAGH
jgi:CHAT domain-containing protein/predicted negative regulator of RcsB-dependent stress response